MKDAKGLKIIKIKGIKHQPKTQTFITLHTVIKSYSHFILFQNSVFLKEQNNVKQIASLIISDTNFRYTEKNR